MSTPDELEELLAERTGKLLAEIVRLRRVAEAARGLEEFVAAGGYYVHIGGELLPVALHPALLELADALEALDP